MKVDHEIKITPDNFKAVICGNKKAELRYDDRDYKVCDIVLMREWMPKKKKYTGKGTHVRITHMIQCSRLIEGAHSWVVFSFEEIVL